MEYKILFYSSEFCPVIQFIICFGEQEPNLRKCRTSLIHLLYRSPPQLKPRKKTKYEKKSLIVTLYSVT